MIIKERNFFFLKLISVFASDCVNYTFVFSDVLVFHATCSSFIFIKICLCTIVYIIVLVNAYI